MALQSVLLGSFVLTDGMIGLALAIACLKFGRSLHIALWSAAFFMLSFANAALIAEAAWPAIAPFGSMVATIASLMCPSLFSQGFRERAGLRDWRRLAIVAVAMTGACAVLVVVRPDHYLNRTAIDACAAVLFVLSAQALRADARGFHGAARVTFWLLAGFAAYIAALALLSLYARPGGPLSSAVYEFAAVMGASSGFVALGLFSMLLVAADMSERLQRLASLDPLTGVLNRRGFDHAASRMFAQCRRFDRPFAIVIADLDRFKSINDRFGHALGDQVLRRFAGHCEATVRDGDLVGRLGGEEFVLVLPDSGSAAATDAIERLRDGLAGAFAELALPVPVTASFGIASLEDRDATLSALLVRADAALYRSKRDGRDRVTIARDDPPQATDPRFLAAFARAGEAAAREAVGL